MEKEPGSLPDNVSHCHAIIADLQKEVEQNKVFIRKLQHQIESLLRHRYGQRADRINPNQLVFEAMQELMKSGSEPEESAKEGKKTKPPKEEKKRKGHGRTRLPEHLRRERVEHEISPEELVCKQCGREKERFGEEVSERLEFQPASLYVIQDVRPKVACRACESGAVTATKPMQPIEKGLPGPGLLAHVVTSKYADHLPLHRLEGILKRQGVDVSRKTMCDWTASCAELLNPLYDLMKEEILQSKVIHTDDTSIPVQDPDCTRTRTGRIWVYIGSRDHPYTVYDYTPSRGGAGPAEFLKAYCGYLQADAYAGYDGIYAGGDVHEVACWAHVRRKWVDAQTTDLSRAVIATAWIKMLYRVEEEARDLEASQRLTLRQEKSAPLLSDFKRWLREQEKTVLPKSPIGEATNYTLNNWEALNRYLEDGDLAIDNNAAERALRGIVIGRKNWLFAGSDKGGRTAAVLFSFVMTCKNHRIDPFAYFRDVFNRISPHPVKRLSELLPDKWQEFREEN